MHLSSRAQRQDEQGRQLHGRSVIRSDVLLHAAAADIRHQRGIAGTDHLTDDALTDDEGLPVDVRPCKTNRGHIAVIDRSDAKVIRAVGLQNHRRPVAEDFRDALDDRLIDPVWIDVR